MLVSIQGNYDLSNLFRQTPDNDGKWEDWQFTLDNVKKCDYLVVLNHPSKNIQIQCRKGGKILIIQEPPYDRNKYLFPYFKYFDKVICDFKTDEFKNIIRKQSALPWLINKNFKELNEMQPFDLKKQDKISWVTSNSRVNPGHEPRLAFLDNLFKTGYKIDIFGRGIKDINDKFEGISPYKYTLAIENYAAPDYWTEKIADAYLSWAMPVYYGCSNIGDYFPEESFIKIDIFKPEEAKEIIEKAIKDQLWDKNINAIKEARLMILNNYQLFPYLKEMFSQMDLSSPLIKSEIPIDPNLLNGGIVQRLKNILNKIK